MQLLKQDLDGNNRVVTEMKKSAATDRKSLTEAALAASWEKEGDTVVPRLAVIGTGLDTKTKHKPVVNVIALHRTLVFCNVS